MGKRGAQEPGQRATCVRPISSRRTAGLCARAPGPIASPGRYRPGRRRSSLGRAGLLRRLNGRLYTPIDEKPKSGRPLKRLRNIEANPHVALVCDRYDEDWSLPAWVHVRGTATLVTNADELSRAIAALRERYPQCESMALEERSLIRIDPENASSWGALA